MHQSRTRNPQKPADVKKGEQVTLTKVVVLSSALQASYVKHRVHMIKSQESQGRI